MRTGYERGATKLVQQNSVTSLVQQNSVTYWLFCSLVHNFLFNNVKFHLEMTITKLNLKITKEGFTCAMRKKLAVVATSQDSLCCRGDQSNQRDDRLQIPMHDGNLGNEIVHHSKNQPSHQSVNQSINRKRNES